MKIGAFSVRIKKNKNKLIKLEEKKSIKNLSRSLQVRFDAFISRGKYTYRRRRDVRVHEDATLNAGGPEKCVDMCVCV